MVCGGTSELGEGTKIRAMHRALRFACGAVVCLALGTLTTVAIALDCARRFPLGANAGREAVRFPGDMPPALATAARPRPAAPAEDPDDGANLAAPFVALAAERAPLLRCGIVAVREERFGTIDLRVQTGAIIRPVDGTYDSDEGAAERVVPLWARDLLVPWGWDGAWSLGQQSVRHVQATGWPWPALASVSHPTMIGPSGPVGWQPTMGALMTGPATATGAGRAQTPHVWPTLVLWRGLLADVAAHAVAWSVLLWSMIRFLGWSRRALRTRRGACRRCGYSLAGNSAGACPECGHPLPARREARPASQSSCRMGEPVSR